MSFIFHQCEHSKEHLESVNRLRQLAANTMWFEELIHSWVKSEKSVIIGLNQHMPDTCLTVSFLCGEETIAMASKAMRDVEEMVGSFERLNETTHDLADKDGHVAEEDWFIERNERLNIIDNFELDRYQIPAKALGELVLSYVQSSAGLVRVDLYQSIEKLAFEDYYDIKLVFLGKDLNKGWHEELLLPCEELELFIEEQKELERTAVFSTFGPYVK